MRKKRKNHEKIGYKNSLYLNNDNKFKAFFKDKKNVTLLSIIFITIILLVLIILSIVATIKKNTVSTVEVAGGVANNTVGDNEEVLTVAVDTNVTSFEEISTSTVLSENSGDTITKENLNKKYYIKVNIKENVVTIYTKDRTGEYTNAEKAFICSTGTYTPTSGRYVIKSRWNTLRLEGDDSHKYLYGIHVTQITGNILFHSVPYATGTYSQKGYNVDHSSLLYEEYDKLGTSCSHGCVRLQAANAKWIFDHIEEGTVVEFYSSNTPSPLGKPVINPISQNVEKRNWDPTDYSYGNPWLSKEESIKIREAERYNQIQQKMSSNSIYSDEFLNSLDNIDLNSVDRNIFANDIDYEGYYNEDLSVNEYLSNSTSTNVNTNNTNANTNSTGKRNNTKNSNILNIEINDIE